MFFRDDVLILMLLRFPQEIRASTTLELPASSDKEWEPKQNEVDLALRLIHEMTGKWTPAEYHDEYREALMDFIETKVTTGDTVDDMKQPDRSDRESGEGKVLDLAEYLQRSIKAGGSAEKKGSKPSQAAKRPAKKAVKKVAKKTPTKKGRRSA